MESAQLQVFKRCGHGTKGNGSVVHSAVRLMLGLDGLKGLF